MKSGIQISANFNNDPSFELVVLSPFNTAVGKLEVNLKEARWKDSSGVHHLLDHPLFARWMTDSWVDEMAFFFGIVRPAAGGYVMMNEFQQPRTYTRGDRFIDCEYTSTNALTPEFCQLSAPGLSGALRLSGVDCRH